MFNKNLGLNAFKRYLTLKTHHIYALPIAILMPHSGCNCRCVMCDIWQNKGGTHQITLADIEKLLISLRKLGTQWVVMSGGEALMNPKLFQLCDLLRGAGIKVTILSTGLLLKRYAQEVVQSTDEVIVSLDGSPTVHDAIRRIPNAYQKLQMGVQAVKALAPTFPLSARCVIHRHNFVDWPNIVTSAQDMGLDSISFLPADVSTEAFNRPDISASETQNVQLTVAELPQLKAVIEALITDYADDFSHHYIAESPAKIRRIYDYYAALHGLADFPTVRCNAPWVSAVVEADGTVRSCFFHAAIGNIQQNTLPELLNQPQTVQFRRELDMATNEVCRKCVCSLNLSPTVKL